MFEQLDTIVLVATSFFTAMISGAMGFLGGTILLSVMAQFVPMQVLIPLHGAVQFWSNGTRVLFLLKHVRWNIFAKYSVGLLVGAALATQFLMKVNEGYYNLALGLFVLLITLMPKPKKGIRFPGKWLFVGFVASFMGLFMGAVGTFVGAMFLSEPFEKRELVATQAMCQTLLHAIKVIIFIYLGFQILDWWILLVLILGATVAGTFWGTRILEKIPQDLFVRILKSIIVVLSLRLVYKGLELLHLVG